MQIPEEFYDFCLYLHQDSFYMYGTDPKNIAAGAMEHMSKEQNLALRAFLNHLLTGGYSDDELQKIYRDTDPEISFHGEELRYFLALVRDAINRGL
ncbi:MAG: hypothetical protein QOF14_1263 [Hyphomicrobiales bacterium]|nr:hypothetical protein [Hyphomicrobiales bacterium]